MKNCPSVDELANVLDTAYHAVDQSQFGPFYNMDGPDLRNKKVNQLAFAILPVIIQSVIKAVEFEGIKDEHKE